MNLQDPAVHVELEQKNPVLNHELCKTIHHQHSPNYTKLAELVDLTLIDGVGRRVCTMLGEASNSSLQ